MALKGVSLAVLGAVAIGGGAAAYVAHRASVREAAAEASYPPTGQILTVDGLRVHAHVEGQGPDLVLIHGSSGNTRDFTFSFVDALKSDYRVIVFDRPGLGWSDRLPGKSESIADQARHLQKAAAQLGADRPIVLGQSYGGAVALAWAVNLPDTLSALVLVAAGSQRWEGGLPLYYKLTSSPLGQALAVPFLTAFVGRRRIDAALDEIFAPQPTPPGYGDYIGVGLTLRRASIAANADQRASLKREIHAQQGRYAEITVPTEMVHGTADTTVPIEVHAQPLVRQIPGANLTALPGIGHMPHHVARDEVRAAIDRAATRAGLR